MNISPSAELTSGVSRRIAELIKDAGSLRSLAIRAGLPPSALSQYQPKEKGRVSKPSAETLARIARAADVRLEWILFGTGIKRESDEGVRVPDEIALIQVPRLEVRAAAGAGAEVDLEGPIEWLAFRAEWVKRRLKLPAGSLRLITATGSSMEPLIRDGDLLMITTAEPRYRDGEIHLVRKENQLLVKRVHRARDGYMLVSENPPGTVQFAHNKELEILGRVVWRAGRL